MSVTVSCLWGGVLVKDCSDSISNHANDKRSYGTFTADRRLKSPLSHMDYTHPISRHADLLTTINILQTGTLPHLITQSIKHLERLSTIYDPQTSYTSAIDTAKIQHVLGLATNHLSASANITTSRVRRMPSRTLEETNQKVALLKEETNTWAEIERGLDHLCDECEHSVIVVKQDHGLVGLELYVYLMGLGVGDKQQEIDRKGVGDADGGLVDLDSELEVRAIVPSTKDGFRAPRYRSEATVTSKLEADHQKWCQEVIRSVVKVCWRSGSGPVLNRMGLDSCHRG